MIQSATAISRRLTAWYDASGLKSPFAGMSAYAIWVSEVMLQQTQMQTALPYHERFMARFPTVDALATAPVQEVLAVWSGLGYYARARKLHAAAGQVWREYGGRLPEDLAALRRLPGVGAYTAGAVASQAFGVQAAAVDANAARALCRLYAVDGDPKTPRTARELWRLAADLVPDENPGQFNVALMVFGARVCRPKNPVCTSCVVSEYCRAHLAGQTAHYPTVGRRQKTSHQMHAAGLLQDEAGRALLVCRPEDGLWGGMWELPRAVQEAGESPYDAAARAVLELTGIRAQPVRTFGTIKHSVMNCRITLTGVALQQSEMRRGAPVSPRSSEWIPLADATSRALPAPQKRLLELAASMASPNRSKEGMAR
ncbi:MAG: A/G-specific adenine glycosylase [Armatimonadetes bacterium]|nr:A/G-specific adenine glycosylase [Armatimonadota bacterium]MDE2205961.1 A/G-specific adenine glycosylase [Armatimonadota bacterium]